MSQNLIPQIQLLACNRATVGWDIPSGQSMPISSNTVLFDTIGNEYGGNGTTTLDLPTMAPLNKVSYCCNTLASGTDYMGFAPIVGEVILWSGMRLPEGWMDCDGQFVLNQESPSLYSVIGDTFGSNVSGRENFFALPKIANPTSSQSLRYIICAIGYEASALEGFASSIKWFAGKTDTLPTGWEKCTGQWLLCDGSTIKVSEYPELYSVIGHLYGGNESTFKLPDYSGQFIRSVGDFGDTSVDSREAATGIGTTPKNDLQIHQHRYTETSIGTTTPGTSEVKMSQYEKSLSNTIANYLIRASY